MRQNLVVVHFQNAEVRVIVDVGQGCQASFKLTPGNELTPTNATH